MTTLTTIFQDYTWVFLLPLVLFLLLIFRLIQLAWITVSVQKSANLPKSGSYQNTPFAEPNTLKHSNNSPVFMRQDNRNVSDFADETDMREVNLQTHPEFMQSGNFGFVEIIACSETYSGPSRFALEQPKIVFGFKISANPHVDVALPHSHVSGQHFSVICHGRGDYNITNLSQRPRSMVLQVPGEATMDLKPGQTEQLYRGDVYLIRDDVTDLKLRFDVLAVSRQDLTQ